MRFEKTESVYQTNLIGAFDVVAQAALGKCHLVVVRTSTLPQSSVSEWLVRSPLILLNRQE